MDAPHHDIELREQFRRLIERSIFVDIDLDPRKYPEGRQLRVQPGNLIQLQQQTLCSQTVRYREPRRMVGQHHVRSAQPGSRPRHLLDR